jgi:hypothetical protein
MAGTVVRVTGDQIREKEEEFCGKKRKTVTTADAPT